MTDELSSRVEHHLERALEHSDDESTRYHLREALHLLQTVQGSPRSPR